MNTKHHLTWSDLAETVGANGVAKSSLIGAGVDMVRLTIPAGTQAGRHAHAHEQIIHVVSGSGHIETDQGRMAFGPGSLFHFPADTWHAADFEMQTVLVEVNLAG